MNPKLMKSRKGRRGNAGTLEATEAEILSRLATRISQQKLAREMGVSQTTISNAARKNKRGKSC